MRFFHKGAGGEAWRATIWYTAASLFTKAFAVRPTLAITMGKGLRSKSLSVEEYRLLWQMLVGKEIDSLAPKVLE